MMHAEKMSALAIPFDLSPAINHIASLVFSEAPRPEPCAFNSILSQPFPQS
jgi:hypothetical protein